MKKTQHSRNTTTKHLTMKIEITFKHYDHSCADGCCLDYGIITTVNGEELDFRNTDTETIVEGILEKLGYNVTIENIYED
jgi:hypothetical protein